MKALAGVFNINAPAAAKAIVRALKTTIEAEAPPSKNNGIMNIARGSATKPVVSQAAASLSAGKVVANTANTISATITDCATLVPRIIACRSD